MRKAKHNSPNAIPRSLRRLASARVLSRNRRICRQVLDCGDGVREVTALALAAVKMPKRAANTAIPSQSGDSEDSVAAVQDARAPTRAALASWSRGAPTMAW